MNDICMPPLNKNLDNLTVQAEPITIMQTASQRHPISGIVSQPAGTLGRAIALFKYDEPQNHYDRRQRRWAAIWPAEQEEQ